MLFFFFCFALLTLVISWSAWKILNSVKILWRKCIFINLLLVLYHKYLKLFILFFYVMYYSTKISFQTFVLFSLCSFILKCTFFSLISILNSFTFSFIILSFLTDILISYFVQCCRIKLQTDKDWKKKQLWTNEELIIILTKQKENL